MSRVATLLCLALLLLGVGCTQVRFRRGEPLDGYVDSFRPGVSEYHDVLEVLGPPWKLSRTPEGFAFLYERVETLENQIGISADSAFNLLGFTDRAIAIPQMLKSGTISVADWVRILYAWE